jgi:hypothetical protein
LRWRASFRRRMTKGGNLQDMVSRLSTIEEGSEEGSGSGSGEGSAHFMAMEPRRGEEDAHSLNGGDVDGVRDGRYLLGGPGGDLEEDQAARRIGLV